jgi:hypothetical protein
MLSVFGQAERNEFGAYPSKEATTATTVDGQGERPVFTDGPYLETKEHLGGFWVIEAADLDEALALAVKGSKACRGKVEVRPFQSAESFQALLES